MSNYSEFKGYFALTAIGGLVLLFLIRFLKNYKPGEQKKGKGKVKGWKNNGEGINYQDVKQVEAKEPSKGKLIAGLMISLVPAALLGNALEIDSVMIIIGIWALYMLPIVLVYLSRTSKKNEPYLLMTRQIQFYSECKDNHIIDLSTPANKQKAQLIAQRLGCSGYNNFEAYFKNAKRLYLQKYEKEQKEQRRDTLMKLKAEEEVLHEKLTRYANYQGRDKRVAMLTDEHAQLKQKAKDMSNAMWGVMGSTQQKELDWATRGGIASGLAGPGAGAAAAVDAQIKNAQIRAQNQANMEAMAPLFFDGLSKSGDYEKAAERVAKALEAARIKLVADTGKNKVLGKLNISLKKVDISDTGAFTVKAAVSAPNPITIFDNVPAVIDGTISADLYQKGKLVGQALMALPTYGVEKNTVEVEGICLSGAQRGVGYEVKFTAHHLWEMEK